MKRFFLILIFGYLKTENVFSDNKNDKKNLETSCSNMFFSKLMKYIYSYFNYNLREKNEKSNNQFAKFWISQCNDTYNSKTVYKILLYLK